MAIVAVFRGCGDPGLAPNISAYVGLLGITGRIRVPMGTRILPVISPCC
jgi:hypothetical protein